jgi:N-methylhydantoinase B
MIDPITLEVLRHHFSAIAEEMGSALIRTAYSTNIKDRRDASCALFDKNGDTIAQAEHIPIHLGVLPWGVKGALGQIDVAALRPGDAIIHNDPFIGGTHTPDIIIFAPIFIEGELLAFTGTLAHHVDIGGPVAGSLPGDATSIFLEGLRIPPMKIREGGLINEDLIRLIQHNSRTPYEVKGDLLGQLASNNVGGGRFEALCESMGAAVVREGIPALAGYCDRRMRVEVGKLAGGVYSFTDYLDPAHPGEAPINLTVEVTIKGETIHFDFSGTHPQVDAPLNAVRPMTLSAIYYVLRAITDATIPANSGAFRCMTAATPEGSIVNARFPAPTGMGNSITSQRLVDTLLGALAQAVPEKVCAAGTGSMNGVTIGGFDEPSQHHYLSVETYGGGYGAHAGGDGESGVHTHMTNTFNSPVEVLEQTLPLKVMEYALAPDSEGAGQYRGGLGIRRVLEMETDGVEITVTTGRTIRGPWGVAGGQDGAKPKHRVHRNDGSVERLGSRSHSVLDIGEQMVIESAGGGGWGDVSEREQAAVRRDVEDGLISGERAERVYGFGIDKPSS